MWRQNLPLNTLRYSLQVVVGGFSLFFRQLGVVLSVVVFSWKWWFFVCLFCVLFSDYCVTWIYFKRKKEKSNVDTHHIYLKLNENVWADSEVSTILFYPKLLLYTSYFILWLNII